MVVNRKCYENQDHGPYSEPHLPALLCEDAHLQECTTTTSLFLCELCRMVSWICPSGDCPRVVPLGKHSRE